MIQDRDRALLFRRLARKYGPSFATREADFDMPSVEEILTGLTFHLRLEPATNNVGTMVLRTGSVVCHDLTPIVLDLFKHPVKRELISDALVGGGAWGAYLDWSEKQEGGHVLYVIVPEIEFPAWFKDLPSKEHIAKSLQFYRDLVLPAKVVLNTVLIRGMIEKIQSDLDCYSFDLDEWEAEAKQ